MNQLTYNYINISPPGLSENFVTGINDVGQVVGWAPGTTFIYSGGIYTTLRHFVTIQVTSGIDDQGQVVGFGHLAGIGNNFGIIISGNTLTQVRDPLSLLSVLGTELTAINDLGQITGISEARGFLFDGGVFTTISDPLSTGTTNPQGINNAGQIVGYYLDSVSLAHGFVYENGIYTTLDDPLATGGTYVTGINNTGQMVGYYYDATGYQHGFLYNSGTYTTLDNPFGVGGTSLSGINDYGQIVGNYIDSAGKSHGFLGTLAFFPEIASKVVYTKVYGFHPDDAQLNILIEFTTPQYAYGQQIGVMSPSVYAFEALGLALASTANLFQNTYGPSNSIYPNTTIGDAQFVTDAYNDVFGHPGNSAQVQHFVTQLNFFEDIYTASGSFGSAANVNLSARSAIYGQMLGVRAEVDPFGPGGAAGTAEVAIVGVSAASDAVWSISP